MSDPNEPVFYILIRKDLALPPGKLASQTGHAVHLGLRNAQAANNPNLAAWEAGSYPKVALAVNDERHLLKMVEEAALAGHPNALVTDEGRTVVGCGTRTCAGVGPVLRADAPYLKRLQLYR